MKKFFVLLTLCTLTCHYVQGQVSSLIGSHLYYESIDSVNIRIWVQAYRDCSSPDYVQDTISIETSLGTSTQLMSLFSVNKVSQNRQFCADSSTCPSSYGKMGIEEVLLVDTVSLNSLSDCWIKISWTHRKRHNDLNPFHLYSSIPDHKNFIEINRCRPARSLSLRSIPKIYFSPFTYYTSVQFPLDFRNPMNSFYLDLDTGNLDSFGIITSFPYSSQGVLNSGFAGFNTWNNNNPLGGFIYGQPNEISLYSDGEINITPRRNQYGGSAYVLQFQNFIDSAGIPVLSSKSNMDMAVFVADTSSKTPFIYHPTARYQFKKDPLVFEYKIGQYQCKLIEQRDSNSSDSVSFNWIKKRDDIDYHDTTVSGRNALSLCWKADSINAELESKALILQVEDHACNFPLSSQRKIYLKPRFDPELSLQIDSLGCNFYRIRMVSPVDSAFHPYVSIFGQNKLNALLPIHAGSDTFLITDTVDHQLYSNYTNHGKYLSYSLDTSVHFNLRKLPTVYLGGDKYSCVGNILNITPDSVNNALSPVHFTWYNKSVLVDTTSTYTLTIPNDSLKLRLKIMDGEGCISNEDTVNIYSIKPPHFKVLSDTAVCAGTQVMFNSSILDTNYSYSVLWDNQHSGKSSTYSLDSTRWIQAIFHETVSNCVIKDSVYAQVNVLPQIQNINDTLICSGESLTIRPVVNAGSSPFSFYYNGVLGTDSFHTQVTQDIMLQLIVIDSFSCSDSLTTNIKSQNLIPISLSSSSLSECVNAPNFDLSAIGSPAGGIWQGAGVINDTLFSPSLVGVGNRLLSYSITDSFGCKSEALLNFNVLGLPQIQYISSSTSGPVPLVVNFTNQSPNSTKVYWAFGVGNDIDSGNQVSYTYQNIGNYSVQILVKDSNCWDTLIVNNLINVTPSVGILDQQTPELSVYPIPAEKQLTIESTETEFSKVSVYDLSGKLLIDEDLNPALKYKLDLSGLASGSYILQVQYLNGQQITKKFLVK